MWAGQSWDELSGLGLESHSITAGYMPQMDRYDGQDVSKVLSVLPVVVDLELDLVLVEEGLGHLACGVLVGDAHAAAGWLLEESAVPPNYFAWRVAGHLVKCVGGVHDRGVGKFEVTESEGYRAVDGSQVDDSVRTCPNLQLPSVRISRWFSGHMS